MFRRFSIAMACVAVIQMTGAHLGVMQGVAWTKMLLDYSREVGWIEATSRTFDGQHPCSMCHQVQKEAQKENADPFKAGYLQFFKTMDLINFPSIPSLSHLCSQLLEYDTTHFLYTSHSDSPLLRPPIS